MRRCGNVRSEKPMLTVLRDQRARNTPKKKGESDGSPDKFFAFVIMIELA